MTTPQVFSHSLDEVAAIAPRFGMDVRATSAPSSGFIETEDEPRIHYLDWGPVGAPQVVFAHGGWLTARTWDLMCAELADRFRCIALDLRGHGHSGWDPLARYTVEGYANDITSVVDALGLEPSVMVGMSVGGLAAAHLAVQAPHRVRGVVLVDILPGPGTDRAAGIDELLLTDVGWSLEDFVAQAMQRNPERDRDALRYFLSSYVREAPGQGWVWWHDPVLDDERVIAAILNEQNALLGPFTALDIPTVLVRGSHGDVTPAKAAAVAGRMRRCEVVTIPGAGHVVQEHNPRALNDCLLRFMETL